MGSKRKENYHINGTYVLLYKIKLNKNKTLKRKKDLSYWFG